jgi:hypothetical protein
MAPLAACFSLRSLEICSNKLPADLLPALGAALAPLTGLTRLFVLGNMAVDPDGEQLAPR